MINIIAEVGVNHGGSIALAHKYIDACAQTGANYVKFQTWYPGEITGKYTEKAAYMQDGLGQELTRYDISNRLRIDHVYWAELKAHADEVGIGFLSTPDGHRSLDFLVDNKLINCIKVGSTEINNIPFLQHVNQIGLPVLLSTGTATLSEVASAVEIFQDRLDTLTLLQCTSSYPCPDDQLHLRVIPQYRTTFQCEVGFSDHSLGSIAAIAAVSLGASVIEKHVYIDSEVWTPDGKASQPYQEFKSLVSDIRRLELMLGSCYKHRTSSEVMNLDKIRRTLVASSSLPSGHLLTSNDISIKRAKGGIDIRYLEAILGRRLSRDFSEDEPFEFTDFA